MATALTPKTTIGTLLSDYPFLLDYLSGYHPEFKKLTNPVTRRTVARFATVERAAAMAGVPTEKLLSDIAARIAAETGIAPQTAATTAAGVDPARQEELKAIIRDLHAGQTPEQVKPRFEELIKDVEATEIAQMEQALIAEGLPDTEVKRLCDVHMQVFQDALEANPALCVPEGHPIDSLQRENQVVLGITKELREAAGRIVPTDRPEAWEREKASISANLARLADLEKHYVRKENQLFPFLEKHGVEGPTKVMWALHDDIRAAIKQLREAVSRDDPSATVQAIEQATTMVDDMVNKEEKVLFPMAFDVLPEEDWRAIRAGEQDVDYGFGIEPPAWPAEGEGATRLAGAQPGGAPPVATPAGEAGALLALHTGALSLEQLNLLLLRLPVDVTYVDENDEVRYYSEGERVFPRSPGIIGRKVQNCHPPASVHKVQEIIDAFRAGEKDVAEFWIELSGKFIHIRYFALRDVAGAYRGVVEVVQDVTRIRALEGQRRLVDW